MKNLKDINNTNFLPIPSLEEYTINEDGIIKSVPKIRLGNLTVLNNHDNTSDKSQRHYKGKIIKQSFKQRYWYVQLTHNGIKKDYRVHRLVYMAFKGNIPDNMVIDHIDGNTSNNNISNLRCVSQRVNVSNPNTIAKTYKSVTQYDLDNTLLRVFSSVKEASKFVNGDLYGTHIGQCCNNKRNSAYGYKWKWTENSL